MTATPQSFSKSFCGPNGQYSVVFRSVGGSDGDIEVSIDGISMTWTVDSVDCEGGSGIVMGGMTTGSEAIWGDQFWFELRPDDSPPVIRYWGDQVIWREDRAA